MANLGNFNAREVEPMLAFETVPSGKYVAVIIASEMKTTKAGDGEYLQFTFKVVEGEHGGARLWARLNLDNPSPRAVELAKAELSAICRAVGVLEPKDSSDLHDLPLVLDVRRKKYKDRDEFFNDIRGYSEREPAAVAESVSNDAAKDEMPLWSQS